MKFLLIAFTFAILPFASHGQIEIVNGPMLGYAEMREVMIWVQLDKEAEVYLEFYQANSPEDVRKSTTVHTTNEQAYTAHLCCQLLEPGQTYEYKVIVNEQHIDLELKLQFTTQELWQYRKDPPAFSVAVGSCNYINDEKYDRPGKPYGGQYEIFESINASKPDIMLWLGDNTYFRDADLASESTMNYRYTHTRNIKELNELFASCHHYAIWDDHDYGPDNSTGSFEGKESARAAFQNFWANKQYGQGEQAIYSKFSYHGVDFFLLDNRWFRTAKDCKGVAPTVLGGDQINWFIQALDFSRAKYKIVCIGGQFLSDFEQYENYVNYPEERNLILNLIEQNNIEGVVFLTGDRHSTELTKLELGNGNWVYDLTVSPLTSGSYDHSAEANTLVEKKTRVSVRNYAILNFSGSEKERQLKMAVFNSAGKLQWEQTIE